MILPGRLRSTTLGDVLGTLHRARVWGELELIGHEAPYRGCHHFIFLRDGLVSDVRTPLPVPPIGEVLLQQGDLTSEQHRQFLAALHGRSSVLAGQVLVNAGFATPERVLSRLGLQNRLRLDTLFRLKDADLRFHPMSGRKTRTPHLHPTDFLHERPRARDSQGSHPRASNPALQQAFETLGLPPNSPPHEVRRAFRRLALNVHPDLHTHLSKEAKQGLETRFAELSQAYHTIVTRSPDSPTT